MGERNGGNAASPDLRAPTSPEALYRSHRSALVAVAALMLDDREQAKEVVNDAFAELIERWDSIDEDRALGYLYRTVSNRSRSWLRRRRTARAFRPEPSRDAPGADVGVLHAEGYRAILAAVRQLPGKQRQVIVLRYYADLDLQETAAAMDISENAVAVNTHRALKTLQRLREDLA